MAFFDNDFKEIFSAQLSSIFGGLIAGTLLAFFTNQLLLVPAMLILLPGFLELRGNISGSFASRISSGLFLGVINPNKLNSRIILSNIIASFVLVFFVSLVLGFFAFIFYFIFTSMLFFKIIFLAVIAGIISNAIEIPLTLILTIYFFKKGHDPNNIMGPFITSTGDIVSIISLVLVLVFL